MKKIILIALFFTSSLFAKSSGFANFNLYPYDTRNFTVYTFEIGINLSPKLKYFSFTNLESQFGTDNEDLSIFYSEQNLYWSISKNLPLHLIGQWAISSGTNNDVYRSGIGWQISKTKILRKFFQNLNLTYTLNWFPIQFDSFSGSYRWQIEHFYYWIILPKVFNNKVYISGFFDHNFSQGSTLTVTEHQLGIAFYKQFYIVSEYRYNGFLQDKSGLALGIQFKETF